MSVSHHFRLFVAGDSATSSNAVNNLRSLCEQRLGDGRFEIEVVDLLENPDAAEEEDLLVLPTLIRLSPEPRQQFIGDLTQPGVEEAILGTA